MLIVIQNNRYLKLPTYVAFTQYIVFKKWTLKRFITTLQKML